jgi:hypothetical protein
MPEAKILDNAGLHRFELQQDGETAFLLYSKTGGSIRLIHTEVPQALRGKASVQNWWAACFGRPNSESSVSFLRVRSSLNI